MASLINARPTAGLLAALLHSLRRRERPAPTPRDRRHYPPQRDKVIEDAAMAREMFRL
ncbi:hypothetical protein [Mycolicibacterium frederiksbergense]|uniref:hypothetical protein n=1 Tax=Mycolicibacterium frederiksbergense TaxID=117567 RepID=UPI00399A0455